MVDRYPHPDAQPPRLDPAQVPADFRHLIPLAERYGVSDDGYRADMLDSITADERAELVRFLADYDNALDAWLAGPESDGPTFSDAYIAFSSLRMAADEVGT
jgi:hypothetical protein